MIQDELKITNPFKVLSRVIMSVEESFKVILSTTKQRTIQFLFYLTIEQLQSTGEQHELIKSVGVLAYSHSFVLGEGHVVFREVGLCDITGEQLFLLDEFVNQSRISQLEYMSNKTGYPLTLDNVSKNIGES